MEKYTPKVGEECLYTTPQGETIIATVTIKSEDQIVLCVKNKWIIVNKGFWIHMKPLPTEEEKLTDELLSLMIDMAVTRDSLKPNDLADKIIKSGYRKVEPIDDNILINNHDETKEDELNDDLFCILNNNHLLRLSDGIKGLSEALSKELHRVGYRKVETIDRKDFVNLYNTCRYENDLYEMLSSRNNIITK